MLVTIFEFQRSMREGVLEQKPRTEEGEFHRDNLHMRFFQFFMNHKEYKNHQKNGSDKVTKMIDWDAKKLFVLENEKNNELHPTLSHVSTMG